MLTLGSRCIITSASKAPVANPIKGVVMDEDKPPPVCSRPKKIKQSRAAVDVKSDPRIPDFQVPSSSSVLTKATFELKSCAL